MSFFSTELQNTVKFR